ncbi:MAG: response regulator [Candidatus Omnitrophota bacterium]
MLKLLVIDDEVDICDFVMNFFKERNFEVLVAYNGKDAVSLVKSGSPDVALLDITMPVMDGIETLKQIRKVNGSIKVIMVTAVDDSEKAEEARRHGVFDYITKPLLLEQLEQIVLMAAGQRPKEGYAARR